MKTGMTRHKPVVLSEKNPKHSSLTRCEILSNYMRTSNNHKQHHDAIEIHENIEYITHRLDFKTKAHNQRYRNHRKTTNTMRERLNPTKNIRKCSEVSLGNPRQLLGQKDLERNGHADERKGERDTEDGSVLTVVDSWQHTTK